MYIHLNDEIVSEHVILQIFNHLHKAPFNYLLMYLINYCTGMRLSDVYSLEDLLTRSSGNWNILLSQVSRSNPFLVSYISSKAFLQVIMIFLQSL